MREHLAHGKGAPAMKVMMCLSVPHRGRWLLWSLNLPLGSAVLQCPQWQNLAVSSQ
jgi:hypothetical protein